MGEETLEAQPHCEGNHSTGWFGWLKWMPTSPQLLKKAEDRMLAIAKARFEIKNVKIEDGNSIHTVVFNKESPKTPLVMIHGFAGGLGIFALNYATLATDRPVYSFDLLGFGRSSRPEFAGDGEVAENQFMESIEQWRKSAGVDDMILLGHSFGGYLASSYALKYPNKIKHLILADPWGFPEWKEDPERGRSFPLWARALVKILTPFNPLAGVRAMGPLGPRVLRRVRSDLGAKFVDSDSERSPIFDYIYHCNALPPSGEVGFKNLTMKIGFAANPMIKRIGGLRPEMPLSFIYGARTWMDISCGHDCQTLLPDSPVTVYSVKAAGHHVYADQPEDFNKIVNSICESVD